MPRKKKFKPVKLDTSELYVAWGNGNFAKFKGVNATLKITDDEPLESEHAARTGRWKKATPFYYLRKNTERGTPYYEYDKEAIFFGIAENGARGKYENLDNLEYLEALEEAGLVIKKWNANDVTASPQEFARFIVDAVAVGATREALLDFEPTLSFLALWPEMQALIPEA